MLRTENCYKMIYSLLLRFFFPPKLRNLKWQEVRPTSASYDIVEVV